MQAFLPLLNNYSAETSVEEELTTEELGEERAFINAIMNTPLMKEAHRYIISQVNCFSINKNFYLMI